MQQGQQVAANIARATRGEAYQPFVYTDRGSMATIGRNQAVAAIKGREFGGFFAWFMWMIVHVFYLNGLKNRALVVTQWVFQYLFYGRNARLITGERDDSGK